MLATSGRRRTVGCARGRRCALASGGKPFEEAVALCAAGLDDASRAAGDAMAAALGDLASAAKSPAALAAVRPSYPQAFWFVFRVW